MVLATLLSRAYALLMLTGIVVSVLLWSKVARRDSRLVTIYIAALGGAFLGAKIAYLLAEGWLYWHSPQRWLILATGKSITGALLGGYVAVEIAKRLVGYHAPTGDWFAIIAPLGIVLGRVGCMLNGCCLGRACSAAWYTVNDGFGQARWPSAQVELFFNAAWLIIAFILSHRQFLKGQMFHIYLLAYGVFRFGHEFCRDTPVIIGPFSGYQFLAAAITFLGASGFLLRQRRLKQQSMATRV